MQFHRLADIGLDPVGDPSLATIARGASGQLLALGTDHVLKLFDDQAADSMIEREAFASRLAARAGLPVPAALDFVRYDGARAILYPRVHGVSMADELRRRPLRGERLLRRWMMLCRQMHMVVPDGLRSFKDVCRTDMLHGPLPDRVKFPAIEYLESLPDGDRLLHGDLHIGNVMLADEALILVDWSKAARGDPAADLVRMDMLMRFGVGPTGLVVGIWRDWATRACQRAYRDIGDVPPERLAAWRPIVALAWLRVGIPKRAKRFLQYANQSAQRVGLPPIELAELRWRASTGSDGKSFLGN
ncbi:phosphotransferase [Sphingobium sp. 3R8]|uniref:phosphotransferase family protein n=1 Tax=Sphingobium sp. 3R8 TaxID=2874921 RepID=UPI001CC936E4|nr:phosphotransferase [Sphingobium sp. 3R8]MBZ9648759.1 phosphotransferase [Sphingobium sp. 3R8]